MFTHSTSSSKCLFAEVFLWRELLIRILWPNSVFKFGSLNASTVGARLARNVQIVLFSHFSTACGFSILIIHRGSLSVILNKKKSEVLTFLSRDSMTMWFSNDNAWMGASCSIESPRLQRRWFFHIFSTCKQLKTRPALCLWQFVFRMFSVESAKLTQYFVKKICEGDMEGGKGGA